VGSMMYHQNDAYSTFMGQERHGRVCGLRLGATHSSLSDHGSSQSFVSASRPEDAQKIAALRLEVALLRQQLGAKYLSIYFLNYVILYYIPLVSFPNSFMYFLTSYVFFGNEASDGSILFSISSNHVKELLVHPAIHFKLYKSTITENLVYSVHPSYNGLSASFR